MIGQLVPIEAHHDVFDLEADVIKLTDKEPVFVIAYAGLIEKLFAWPAILQSLKLAAHPALQPSAPPKIGLSP